MRMTHSGLLSLLESFWHSRCCTEASMNLRLILACLLGLQLLSVQAVGGKINNCEHLLSPDRNYLRHKGGFVRLTDGSVVEGSISNGGLQPHTLIDFEHPALKPLLKEAESLRGRDIQEIIHIIFEASNRILKNRAYEDQVYLKLMQQGRENAGSVLSFGEYVSYRAGTCREYAVFAHLMLQSAGIDNELTYALVTHLKSARDKFDTVTEDHAFVVISHNGQKFIVDPYFYEAHGRPLDHLLTHWDLVRETPAAPWAFDIWKRIRSDVDSIPLRIDTIHDFPAYYIKAKETESD